LKLDAVGSANSAHVNHATKEDLVAFAHLHVVPTISAASSSASKRGILPNFVGRLLLWPVPTKIEATFKVTSMQLVRSQEQSAPEERSSPTHPRQLPQSDVGNKLTHRCFMAVHETSWPSPL
jgi:hypothetical protein